MLQIRPSASALKTWLVWNVVAVALLLAKPWGSFGWDELAACAAPLLLLHPAMRRVNVLTIGLVISSLAWIMAGEPSGGWPELVCLGSILVAGIAIGGSAVRAEAERNAQVPVVASLQDAGDLFLFVLGRELSRARRHDSPFAVLSVDPHSANPELSLDSIAEMLYRELHAYADTEKVGDRVLALVPEVSTEGQHFLVRRLETKAESELGGRIRIGLAHYPQDAMFAEALIDVADRKRCAVTDGQKEVAAHKEGTTHMEGTTHKAEDIAASS
jgi:hypothetical protein